MQPPGAAAPLGIAAISRDVARRVRAGEHLVLWGPRGAGKSTLLASVEDHLAGIPYGRAVRTESLEDITRALERAYPATSTGGVARRTARARLWRAADRESAVLLLDHANAVGTAMKGWLRRLRGGVAGVVLAVDVDSPREREALHPFRLGSASLRMPALAARPSAALLRREWEHHGLPELPGTAARTLLRAARGRPGWLVTCATLAADRRYWRAGDLKAAVLQIDTEMTLRGVQVQPDGATTT